MISESNKHIKNTYVTFIFLLFGIDKALYAEIHNELIIPAAIQYESNPSFSSDDEISIHKRIITPHFISSIEDDRNIWRADFSYHVERSSDTNISDDREDATIGLSWLHDFETGNFSVNARKEEGATRETELSDSGLIRFDGTRISKSTQVGWLKNFSEAFSIELNASGAETNYLNIDLIDYTTRTVSGRVNYRASETLLLFVSTGKTGYESTDNLINNELRDNNIGLEMDLSDTTTAILSLGESDVDDVNAEGKENQGSLTLNFEEQRLTYSFLVARTISPSGVGGFIKADQLIGNVRYALNETSNLGFSINLRKSFDEDEDKTRTLSLIYSKELAEEWTMNLSGSHSEVESTIVDGADNNILSISMSYTI